MYKKKISRGTLWNRCLYFSIQVKKQSSFVFLHGRSFKGNPRKHLFKHLIYFLSDSFFENQNSKWNIWTFGAGSDIIDNCHRIDKVESFVIQGNLARWLRDAADPEASCPRCFSFSRESNAMHASPPCRLS